MCQSDSPRCLSPPAMLCADVLSVYSPKKIRGWLVVQGLLRSADATEIL